MNEITKTCLTLLFYFIINYCIDLTYSVPGDCERELNEFLIKGKVVEITRQ